MCALALLLAACTTSAEPVQHDLCAVRDPNAGDEIAVRFNNAFAENFDFLTGDGYTRTGDGITNGASYPAWF